MTTTQEAPNRTSAETTADRVAKARKLIGAAHRKAAKLRENPELNRSTRQRQALLVEATALNDVGRILAGKE